MAKQLKERLEKRLRPFVIPNLIIWIILGQVLFYGLGIFSNFPIDALTLQPAAILHGEVWRIATFIFVPGFRVITIWVIFAWYLLYMYGSALETQWGEFRFNMFILLGVVLTTVASLLGYFISPFGGAVSNSYFLFTLFLAFAILNPDFELLIFFILPVKVKWLAWLACAGYLYVFILGPLVLKLIILGSFGNLAFFFGKDLMQSVKAGQRRIKNKAPEKAEPFHKCEVCGVTDVDDSDMEFLYRDGKGYCKKHYGELLQKE